MLADASVMLLITGSVALIHGAGFGAETMVSFGFRVYQAACACADDNSSEQFVDALRRFGECLVRFWKT